MMEKFEIMDNLKDMILGAKEVTGETETLCEAFNTILETMDEDDKCHFSPLKVLYSYVMPGKKGLCKEPKVFEIAYSEKISTDTMYLIDPELTMLFVKDKDVLIGPDNYIRVTNDGNNKAVYYVEYEDQWEEV